MTKHRKESVMAYVIAEPCVDVHDRSCVTECPVDCIYDGARKSYIQPDECIDCGACEAVCPVVAIFHEEDLPAGWEHFRDVEREFFGPGVSGLGSPGGAADVDAAPMDHPLVAELPATGTAA
jgi:NAD-dependent dihydropyrimidine dehydrogenase PreA subunit